MQTNGRCQNATSREQDAARPKLVARRRILLASHSSIVVALSTPDHDPPVFREGAEPSRFGVTYPANRAERSLAQARISFHLR